MKLCNNIIAVLSEVQSASHCPNSIIPREKRSTLADIVEQLQEREAAVVSALATQPHQMKQRPDCYNV